MNASSSCPSGDQSQWIPNLTLQALQLALQIVTVIATLVTTVIQRQDVMDWFRAPESRKGVYAAVTDLRENHAGALRDRSIMTSTSEAAPPAPALSAPAIPVVVASPAPP